MDEYTPTIDAETTHLLWGGGWKRAIIFASRKKELQFINSVRLYDFVDNGRSDFLMNRFFIGLSCTQESRYDNADADFSFLVPFFVLHYLGFLRCCRQRSTLSFIRSQFSKLSRTPVLEDMIEDTPNAVPEGDAIFEIVPIRSLSLEAWFIFRMEYKSGRGAPLSDVHGFVAAIAEKQGWPWPDAVTIKKICTGFYGRDKRKSRIAADLVGSLQPPRPQGGRHVLCVTCGAPVGFRTYQRIEADREFYCPRHRHLRNANAPAEEPTLV